MIANDDCMSYMGIMRRLALAAGGADIAVGHALGVARSGRPGVAARAAPPFIGSDVADQQPCANLAGHKHR